MKTLALLSSTVLLVAALGATACGDDDGSGAGGDGAGGSDPTTTSATTTTTSATTGTATTGGTGGSSTTGSGGAGGSTTGTGSGGSGGGGLGPEALALVRGTLFTDDLAEAQAYHDALAAGGEEASKAAGDEAHDTFLGTELLGTQVDQFLAIDRWSSDANMDAFYGDPQFQAAFGALFAGPPAFETFERSTFYSWGSLDDADATEPHYAIVVRGRLDANPDDVQAEHDGIAMGGEDAATSLGDVAHVVYLGRQDPREALFIDLWVTVENLEAFYANPDFQAAVGGLFEAPPTIGVYASNDWHQW